MPSDPRQDALREAYRVVENLPAVVPDHGHGGVLPPYLRRVDVLDALAALAATETPDTTGLREALDQDACMDLRAALATPTPSLDAAWAEAEAALPEGWYFHVGTNFAGSYPAWAGRVQRYVDADPYESVVGPTPAAALLALAEKLRAAK